MKSPSSLHIIFVSIIFLQGNPGADPPDKSLVINYVSFGTKHTCYVRAEAFGNVDNIDKIVNFLHTEIYSVVIFSRGNLYSKADTYFYY